MDLPTYLALDVRRLLFALLILNQPTILCLRGAYVFSDDSVSNIYL